jgi:hypothetical protein
MLQPLAVGKGVAAVGLAPTLLTRCRRSRWGKGVAAIARAPPPLCRRWERIEREKGKYEG